MLDACLMRGAGARAGLSFPAASTAAQPHPAIGQGSLPAVRHVQAPSHGAE